MAEALRLTGYRFSVYTWAARLALAEAGVTDYEFVDLDPFTEAGQAALAPLHPFGRVPVLEHGDFRLWETAAILDYVDAVFAAGAMTPAESTARARMRQVISVVDSYGYWPLVRQVFSHRVFRPLEGEKGDEAEIATGMEHAVPVLAVLEDLVEEGLILNGSGVTLADCHLLPMIDYFARAEEGGEVLKRRSSLSRWHQAMCERMAVRDTRPDQMLTTGDRT